MEDRVLKRLLAALRPSPQPSPSLRQLLVRIDELEDFCAHLERRLDTFTKRSGGMKRQQQVHEEVPATPANGPIQTSNPIVAGWLSRPGAT